ncbi:MAG TPA: RNA polymerase sigma factor region1.1 domain-containing protein, partial [Polyangiaceae bacterium]
MGSKKSELSSKKGAPAAAPSKPVPAKQKPKPAAAKAAKNGSAPAQAKGSDDDDDDDDDVEEISSSFPPPAKANGKAKEQLITLGKTKGFLTYDDVHEALPGEDVGPDQMDDVLSALDDEEIEVVDDASNIKIAPHRGSEED